MRTLSLRFHPIGSCKPPLDKLSLVYIRPKGPNLVLVRPDAFNRRWRGVTEDIDTRLAFGGFGGGKKEIIGWRMIDTIASDR